MAAETIFQFSNPATWIPSIVAGGYGFYAIFRMLRRDGRNDKQEKRLDDAVNQIIGTLRDEVSRLNQRVSSLETALVRCHEERAQLLAELHEYKSTSDQRSFL